MNILLADLDLKIAALPPEQLPTLIGALAILTAKAQRQLLLAGDAPVVRRDELLKVAEAAVMLGMTRDYLYRHADTFPFTVRLASKQLRFSSQGIEQYIARQRVASPS